MRTTQLGGYWVCSFGALLALGSALARAGGPCHEDSTAFEEMLQSEYAFAGKAEASVRDAFLEYLAEDSWVLQPGPTPARAFYAKTQPNNDQLEWYPSFADVAPSGELGFSSGPWIYTTVAGTHHYGHFLTIWKRDADCRWRVQFDGGVDHPAMADVEPKLSASAPLRPDAIARRGAPPASLLLLDEAGRAARDFQFAATENGLAAAVRTFARNGDFRLFAAGETPKDNGSANAYLNESPGVTTWTESDHGRSADSTLTYSVGEFTSQKKARKYAYVQVWQYDSKVANWGLRILLMTPIDPK
jgi:hypothetical protein